jgi:hypothetical protein
MARRVPWFLPTYLELIIVIAFFSFTRQVVSDDLWWHLACGEEFVRRGHVMTVDELSTGSAGAYWTPHYWLWAVVAHLLVAKGGLLLLLLAKGLLAALTVQTLARLLREQGVTRELSLVVTVMVGIAGLFSQFWNIRAQTFTGFAVFWITFLFMRARRTGRLPWVLAPLTMTLWTNMHGGFIFGLVTCGVFLAAACMRRAAGSSTPLEPSKLALLFLLMVGACAINPYGPKYVLYPFSYLGNVHLQTRITEWAGTVVRDYLNLELVILVVVAGCAFVPRASPLEEVGLAGICLHFAFQAARNIFLVGPWLAPLCGPRLDALLSRIESGAPAAVDLDPIPPPDPGAPVPRDRTAWAWTAIALICAARLVHGAEPPIILARPTAIVEWLKTHDVGKPLFNEYWQGGYIMLHLRPRYIPYVDGRADLHIDSGAFVEYTDIIDLKPGWEKLFFDKRKFGSALLEKGMPIANELRKRGWKQVGPDEPEHELLVAP